MYRRNVGMVILNHEKKVFMGKRHSYTKTGVEIEKPWQMPQGGIDESEDPEKAMWRELYEETGINQAKVIAVAPNWIQYDLPHDLQKKFFKGQFKGQKQLWFLLDLNESQIKLDCDPQHQEFIEYEFVPYQEVIERVVDFKRDVYKNVFMHFQNYFTNY